MSFTERFSKGFSQVKQLASEKLGKAEEITDFPEKFSELEAQLENIQFVFERLSKSSQKLITDTYEASVANQMRGLMKQVTNSQGSDVKTLHHFVAKDTLELTQRIADEPTARLLNEYGMAHQTIGNLRLELASQVTGRVINPLQDVLDQTIKFAQKSRKSAHKARLELDAAKSRVRSAKPENFAAVERELKEAESNFKVLVDDAIVTMRSVTENPDTLRIVRDLISAQKSFYENALAALSSIQ